jgi:tyrosine-protein kinase Etk/Wzc
VETQNQKDGLDAGLIFRKIWRKKHVVFLTVISVIIPALVFNYVADPKYTASSTIILEQIDDLPSITQSRRIDYMLREVYIANRMEELKSRSVAKAVVENLPQHIIQKLATELDSTEADFNQNDALVALVYGQPPKKKGRVKVKRIRKSDVVKISFWAKDSEVAFFVVNTFATQYVERHFQIRSESASGIRSFLEQQLEIYRQKLSLSEVALRSFKENNDITVLDKQAEELLSRYTEAEVLYNTTKAESGAKERRLSYLDQKISEERAELVPSLTNISSPWSLKLKSKLVELELQYTELQLQNYSPDHPLMVQMRDKINQTKENLTSEAMKLAQGEGLLDAFAHVRDYLEESLRLQIELEAIKKKELVIENILTGYDSLLKDFPAKEIQLARLKRERNVSEQTYLMLNQKREEARLLEAERKPSIRIIDEAQIPPSPSWPRKKLNLALAFLLGCFLGFGFIFFSEYLQGTVESTEDIEAATGWSVVATIPKFRSLRKSLEKSKEGTLVKSVNDNGNGWEENHNINSIAPPSGSPEAEAFRILARNIQLLAQRENTGLILITSAGPQEGKSTAAINLAVTLANMGQNTLLVDMDFRRPIIHKVFDISVQPGAADLLLHLQSFDGKLAKKQQMTRTASNAKPTKRPKNSRISASLEDIFDTVQSTTIQNLHIIPSGSTDKNRYVESSPNHISVAFDLFRRFFDTVIIDGPPILMVSEASLMSSLADGVVYVMEYGSTTKRGMIKSHKILSIARANVIGCVLNKMNLTRMYGKKEHYYYY